MSSNPAECTILSLWYHRHRDFFIMSEFVSLWLKFMDRWPRQCQRHRRKGAICREQASDVHLFRHCERGAFMRRTRQSSGGQRYSVPMAQVYGSVAAPRAVRVYVPDGTDARDDGERCKCAKAVRAAVAAPRATRGCVPRTGKCYPSIRSLRERRIYAANAAVQRWAKVWCAYGTSLWIAARICA